MFELRFFFNSVKDNSEIITLKLCLLSNEMLDVKKNVKSVKAE